MIPATASIAMRPLLSSLSYRNSITYDDDPYDYIKDFRGNGLYRNELPKFEIGAYIGPPNSIPNNQSIDPSLKKVGYVYKMLGLTDAVPYTVNASTYMTYIKQPILRESTIKSQQLHLGI